MDKSGKEIFAAWKGNKIKKIMPFSELVNISNQKLAVGGIV
jgi:hypothetical protein